MLKGILKKLIPVLCVSLIGSMIWPQVSFASDDKEYPDEIRIIVSMGDSYSAGEGLPPYYGQEDDRKESMKSEDWLAHRSFGCWPGKLMIPGINGAVGMYKDTQWFFTAVSGAETIHLFDYQPKEVSRVGFNLQAELPPQVSVFSRLPKNEVDYVTLTIGGNDVGFVDRIKDAFVKPELFYFDHNGLNSQIEKTIGELQSVYKPRLVNAYTAIMELAGPQAELIVAGYPKLLSTENVHPNIFRFGPNEAQYINDAVECFNRMISNTIGEFDYHRRIHFVSVTGEEGFDGHEAYSDDPYIFPVYLYAFKEDLKQPMLSAASMHPNAIGREVYRNRVQDMIDQIESEKDQMHSNPESAEADLEEHDEASYHWTEEEAAIIHERLSKGTYYLTEGLGFEWDQAEQLGKVSIEDIRKGALDFIFDIAASLEIEDFLVLQEDFDVEGEWICP